MRTHHWNERYSSHDDGLRSSRANGALMAEVAESQPGRALDVAAAGSLVCIRRTRNDGRAILETWA
jgi:hypothetical protein